MKTTTRSLIIVSIAMLIVGLTITGLMSDVAVTNESYFSMLEAFFTGLAFLGVIWTVLLQKDELRLQRDELTQTRSVMEKQSKTFDKQRFETSF